MSMCVKKVKELKHCATCKESMDMTQVMFYSEGSDAGENQVDESDRFTCSQNFCKSKMSFIFSLVILKYKKENLKNMSSP